MGILDASLLHGCNENGTTGLHPVPSVQREIDRIIRGLTENSKPTRKEVISDIFEKHIYKYGNPPSELCSQPIIIVELYHIPTNQTIPGYFIPLECAQSVQQELENNLMERAELLKDML